MFPLPVRESGGDYLVVPLQKKIRNTLISFFCQCHNLQLDSESIRRGYICRNCVRLIEKYNLLHEEVATNTRKALPHLPVTAQALWVLCGL